MQEAHGTIKPVKCTTLQRKYLRLCQVESGVTLISRWNNFNSISFTISGIYLTISMAVTSISVILTVCVLKLHHCGPHQVEVGHHHHHHRHRGCHWQLQHLHNRTILSQTIIIIIIIIIIIFIIIIIILNMILNKDLYYFTWNFKHKVCVSHW